MNHNLRRSDIVWRYELPMNPLTGIHELTKAQSSFDILSEMFGIDSHY